MTLPPPPKPFKVLSPLQSGTDDVVLYERMLEYGAACRAAALEEAIVACHNNANLYPIPGSAWESSIECAAAIRALKDA